MSEFFPFVGFVCLIGFVGYISLICFVGSDFLLDATYAYSSSAQNINAQDSTVQQQQFDVAFLAVSRSVLSCFRTQTCGDHSDVQKRARQPHRT